MTTYTAILDTQIDPDAPLTSSLGYQWRDNPVASFEGASGAPVAEMMWHPYDMTNMSAVGDDTGEGVIFDRDVDGSVASVETPVFVDGYSYRITAIDITGVTEFDFDLYKDTDGSYQTGLNLTTSGTTSFIWNVSYPWISSLNHFGDILIRDGTNNDLFSTSFNDLTVQKVTRARVTFAGGGPSNGRIILEKKLDPLSGAIS